MGTLAELRHWALDQAREGRHEGELVEMLFEKGLEDPDLMRDAWREWCRRVAGDSVAVAVKPAGRSQRAPAPVYQGQLRLGLLQMTPAAGLTADRKYFDKFSGVVSRYAKVVARLTIMEPFAAAHNLDEWATYGEACRAAGMSEEMIADMAQ